MNINIINIKKLILSKHVGINLKKTIYISIFLLISISSFSQQLTFQSEFDKSYKRSDYKSYFSKDSIVFNIDDNIKIGSPSDFTFKHIYIFQSLGYLQMSVTQNHLLDGECTIFAIIVSGSKRKGFFPYINIRNEDGVFFSIDIENAILKGEIKTGLSENDILKILKEEKEKLELGIISVEEFEKRKKELLKQMN